MGRYRIDIGGNDVGFNLVDGGLGRCSTVIDRVDHGEKLPGAPVVALAGKGHGRPDRRMGVLSAVFPDAGNVAFDIAGIQFRLVEWRIEELDQAVLAADEVLVDRFHGPARAFGVSRPG